MKLILEIELEIDGRWKASDRKKLLDMFLENPHHGGWEIDADRLYVRAAASTAWIAKSRRKNNGLSVSGFTATADG